MWWRKLMPNATLSLFSPTIIPSYALKEYLKNYAPNYFKPLLPYMKKIIQAPILLMLMWAWGYSLNAQSLASIQKLKANHPQAASRQNGGKSLKTVLLELEKKYEVSIFYNTEFVDDKLVSQRGKSEKKQNLEDELNLFLTPHHLKYEKVKENFYVISPQKEEVKKIENKKSLAPSNQEQSSAETSSLINNIENLGLIKYVIRDFKVTGKVVSDAKEPLPGVNILQKGTSNGTVTDANGNYSLSLADGTGTLIFSYIGYVTAEVSINNQSEINLTMLPDLKALNEVVVIGYGTQRKSELTTAISSVSEQEIRAVPITSLDQALKGRAAGVQVTQSSSAPGGGVSIRIRGTGSLNAGSEPLYVIDGIPVLSDNNLASGRREGSGQASNALSSLNPGDIESMEILKDGAAASIYGSRGANGVILITTKRGKAGQSNIDFDAYYGSQTVRNKIPLLNATQYAQLVNEANINAGAAPSFTDAQIAGLGKGTDWQDEVFRTAPMQNYQLSVSGGDDKTKYAISGNYYKQDGIVRGSDFNRGSVRINMDRKITDKINMGTSLSLNRSKNNIIVTDEEGVIRTMYKMSPTLPVRDADGNYTFNNTATPYSAYQTNPIYTINEILNEQITTRALGSVFAEYEIVKNLKLRISGGVDLTSTKENFFESDQYRFRNNRFAWVNTVFNTAWINSNTLTYSKTFNEKHSVTLLALYERQYSKNELTQSLSEGPDLTGVNDLRTGLPRITPRSDASDWGIVSYAARANYGFDGKYLVTASLRADGSSKFGKNHKTGFFPAVSLAWVVTRENFLQDIKPLNLLKIRASYGTVGNQNISSYQSLSLLNNNRYIFNNTKGVGFYPGTIPNPDLKWERSATLNVGADIGLIDRINITADFYIKKTNDLLWDFPLPRTTGYDVVTKNIGSVKNTGFELTVNTQNIDRLFKWNTAFNFSTNKNQIVALRENQDSVHYGQDASQILIKGKSIGTFFGYKTNGIFQKGDNIEAMAVQGPGTQPGDRRYVNLDNDLLITGNDRMVLGQAVPKFFGGITNNFSYAGIELSVFFQGVFGNKVYNVTQKYDWESLNGAINNSTEVLKRWTETNPSNTMPRANKNRRGNEVSDPYVQDASFLRLRDVTLAYNLPSSLLNGAKIRKVRIYVSAQNQLTFTKYYGYDPEVNSTGQNTKEIGIDNTPYPMAKSIIFGINVGL